MSDKIRIVGTFGEGVIDKVRSFVDGLESVESVSVLHDGTETYPDADSVKAGQAAGEGDGEAEAAAADTAPDESRNAA